ncbi:MAG: hypothetical protein C5B50_27565 [Verrucomicrobia bacterium]|nr:MAG: hypothetical protein C5B50_27565 [Verrucomicrobiota bacterium]
MQMDVESTDRNGADYLKFGLGFLGTLLGVGGVILASVFLALGGAIIVLLSILALRDRSDE